jgi:hypothetical protein
MPTGSTWGNKGKRPRVDVVELEGCQTGRLCLVWCTEYVFLSPYIYILPWGSRRTDRVRQAETSTRCLRSRSSLNLPCFLHSFCTLILRASSESYVCLYRICNPIGMSDVVRSTPSNQWHLTARPQRDVERRIGLARQLSSPKRKASSYSFEYRFCPTRYPQSLAMCVLLSSAKAQAMRV